MKKLFVTFIICCISLGINAQVEHMTFMGITMNLKIGDFQNQLSKKGVKYDAKASRMMSDGRRYFKGVFSGEKADIFVYYNVKTKLVYRVKAVINCATKEIGQQKFDTFRDMLKTKYSDQIATDTEQDGNPAMSILVTDSKIEYTMGFVNLYITSPYSIFDDIHLHVDYIDSLNEQYNENRNMDDL